VQGEGAEDLAEAGAAVVGTGKQGRRGAEGLGLALVPKITQGFAQGPALRLLPPG
jgi:hypothetical protein